MWVITNLGRERVELCARGGERGRVLVVRGEALSRRRRAVDGGSLGVVLGEAMDPQAKQHAVLRAARRGLMRESAHAKHAAHHEKCAALSSLRRENCGGSSASPELLIRAWGRVARLLGDELGRRERLGHLRLVRVRRCAARLARAAHVGLELLDLRSRDGVSQTDVLS